MISLENKIALVTGGSRGIGAATARLFARAGADVVVNYRKNKRAALEVCADVEKLGRRALPVQADVGSPGDARRLVKSTLKTFGTIDILVNNAGVWTYGAIGQMPEKVWDETMDANLKSVYLMCNLVAPLMQEKGAGAIITIGSTAGQRGEALHSHYAATKGAVLAFTKSLAAELGPRNIRVNVVSPGWVDTDMSADVLRSPGLLQPVLDTIPLRRVATAEDVAGAVLFLASGLARHITGTSINVNGGGVLV
jgi:3-oxoacyl-[acyl-carrier protein] reductase